MIDGKFVGALIFVVAFGGGAILIAHDRSRVAGVDVLATSILPTAPAAFIPTPAWYEAHPDVLKADNDRCATEGKNLPPGLCANVSIADQAVSSQDAMSALDQAGTSAGK